jgi:hypothetical protein
MGQLRPKAVALIEAIRPSAEKRESTAVVMTNAVLMERLCALVPPPRKVSARSTHPATCSSE